MSIESLDKTNEKALAITTTASKEDEKMETNEKTLAIKMNALNVDEKTETNKKTESNEEAPAITVSTLKEDEKESNEKTEIIEPACKTIARNAIEDGRNKKPNLQKLMKEINENKYPMSTQTEILTVMAKLAVATQDAFYSGEVKF